MPPRNTGAQDPNQPTQRAMHYIKNKNNISEMRLRQQLQQFERARAASMYNIDHDRLDVKDFLKEVKYCASDQLPESKLWLGEKGELGRKTKDATRNVATAPAGTTGNITGAASTGGGGAGDNRDIKTAPGGQGQQQKGDGMVQFGIFLAKKKDIDPNKVHQDIYSRRNMYSTIERDTRAQDKEDEEKRKEEQRQKWLEEQAQAAKEEEERKAKEKKEEEERIRKEKEEIRQKQLEEKRAAMLQEEQMRNGEEPSINIKAEMRRIANVREPTEMEKREARIQAMNANADLMKEILMKNAKKRAEKKKKRLVPIENRIREFFTNIDVLKNQQHDMASAAPTIEQQQRFILMTKGLKAAVEFSARNAELAEDNPDNTT